MNRGSAFVRFAPRYSWSAALSLRSGAPNVAIAASLAGPYGEEILNAALRRRPTLLQSPDFHSLLESTREGQFSFEDVF